jgi:hypothetical protein
MVGDREFGCFLYSYGRRLKFVSGTVAVSSPSPPQKEERVGVRRPIISNSNPLAPTLSPLGRGEGEAAVSLIRIIGKPTMPNEAATPAEDDKYQFQPGGKSRRMNLCK